MKTFHPKVMRFIDSGFHELSRFEVKRFYPWIFKAFLVFILWLIFLAEQQREPSVSHPESNQHSVPNYGAIPVKATMHYFGEVLFIKQTQGWFLKNSFSSRWLFKMKANGIWLRRYSSFGRRAKRFESYRGGIMILGTVCLSTSWKWNFLSFHCFDLSRSKEHKV